MAGRLERGEVRLAKFDRPDKQRPVVILTRTRVIPYLARVTIAPITSTIRSVPSEVRLSVDDGMKGDCVVTLENIATLDKQRLGRRVTILNDARMDEVCAAVHFALGC